jgi:hypothetical protein
MEERLYQKSIAYELYQLKNQDPQAYAGVQKFIQTVAPKLEPLENNPHFHGKQQLPSLLNLELAVASVDVGIPELFDRKFNGENNLIQTLVEATDKMTKLMGGEDRFNAVQKFLLDNQNRQMVQEAEARPAPAQDTKKWQDFVAQKAEQPELYSQTATTMAR